jgi:hypothetical protein
MPHGRTAVINGGHFMASHTCHPGERSGERSDPLELRKLFAIKSASTAAPADAKVSALKRMQSHGGDCSEEDIEDLYAWETYLSSFRFILRCGKVTSPIFISIRHRDRSSDHCSTSRLDLVESRNDDRDQNFSSQKSALDRTGEGPAFVLIARVLSLGSSRRAAKAQTHVMHLHEGARLQGRGRLARGGRL